MWAFILKFFTGGAFDKLSSSLADAYKAKQQALTDQDRIEADKQIAFYQQQISLSQATVNDPWWSPRVLMAYCVVAYVAKIVVWDTVLQMGVTPNPGQQVTGIVMLIIGFYYGSKAATDVATRIFAAIGQRR